MPAFGNLLLAPPNLDTSPVKEKMPRLGRVADGDAMFRGYRCGYRADDICDERSGFQIALAQFRRHVPRHEQQSHYLFVCWNCACQFFNGMAYRTMRWKRVAAPRDGEGGNAPVASDLEHKTK